MRKSLEERLNNYTINENGCHIWNGCTDSNGYGIIVVEGKNERVHSVIYQRKFGVKGTRMMPIDHMCNIKNCMNIDHLQKISQRTNTLKSEGNKAAINSRKTHCLNGHEFTEDNTYITSRGERFCRTCARNRMRHNRNTKLGY